MADAVSIKFTARDQFTRISERMNKALSKNRMAFRRLDQQMEKSAMKTKRSSQTMAKSIGSIGKALGAVGVLATVAKVATAGVTSAVTLEQQKNRVLQNVAGRENRAVMGVKIEDAIRKASALSGKSREEIGEGLFSQLSAQGTGQDAFDNFFKNLELATGFTSDLGATIAGVSKLQENFADAANTDQVLSALAAGQTFGQTDVQALVDALPALSLSASQAGFTSTDTIAFLSSMSKKLGGTAEAATATRGFLDTILSARIDTPAGQALMALGLPVGGEALRASGLTPDALALKAAEGLLSNERLFSEAFGNDSAKTIVRAAGPGLTENMNRIRAQVANDMGNLGEGAVALNFESATTGISGSMIDNKAATERLSDEVGKNLTPAVNALTAGIQQANLRSEVQGGGLVGDTERPGIIGNQVGAIIENVVAKIFGKQEELRKFRAEESIKLKLRIDARGAATSSTGGMGDQTVTD